MRRCEIRAAAKAANEKYYDLKAPCKNGHLSKRYVSNGACFQCLQEKQKTREEYSKEYRLRESYKNKKPEYDKRGKQKYRVSEKGIAKRRAYDARPDVMEKKRDAIRARRKCPQVRQHEREYEKEYLRKNPNAKLARILRARTRDAMKSGIKPSSCIKMLGCSINDARRYIEKKFKPGMSWENHGMWHIDHIKPLCSFDLSDEEQYAAACHVSNLQPLWRAENQSKGGRA